MYAEFDTKLPLSVDGFVFCVLPLASGDRDKMNPQMPASISWVFPVDGGTPSRS